MVQISHMGSAIGPTAAISYTCHWNGNNISVLVVSSDCLKCITELNAFWYVFLLLILKKKYFLSIFYFVKSCVICVM